MSSTYNPAGMVSTDRPKNYSSGHAGNVTTDLGDASIEDLVNTI